jgi:hypothetical protein
MRKGAVFLVAAFFAVVIWPESGPAALITNSPREITHRVTVQMIQTARSNGSSPATLFGTASQRATIETHVDTIWAQAGIDIHFLSTINRWNNTFAYEGNPATFDEQGRRPTGDLGTIVSTGDAAGVTTSTPSIINQFFVNIVPGFPLTSENSANGIANIGRDGTAQFVGDGLLTFAAGLEVIASVVAHEIGHVLGLKHTANSQANLMSPQGTTEQLTADQIAAVFQTTFRNDSLAFIPSGGTGFPQALSMFLTGDYNRNGAVDAADYTVWRNSLGSRTDLAADGDGDRIIDRDDYTVWKTHYGESTGTGGLAARAIPEPGTLVLLLTALMAASRLRHYRR